MSGLRWGILATGGIADSFAFDLRANGFNLVAVGSRTQDSADAFAARHGIRNAHGSYESLAADPDVDIVYVATPHPQHLAAATTVLEQGKHALVEKAFTVTRGQAEELQRLAAERGLLVMEAMWTRYLPHMQRVRDLIAAGALGEVRAVDVSFAQRLSDDPSHRLNALELGGGALLDLGIYPLSFIWDVLGAPETVRAVGRLGETGADTEVATVMTHAGGAVSSALCSSRATGPKRATVLGTRARLEIDHRWFAPTTMRLIGSDDVIIEEFDGRIPAELGSGKHFEALAAERLVRDGILGGDLLTLDETVEIMGCLDEIRAQIGVHYPGIDA